MTSSMVMAGRGDAEKNTKSHCFAFSKSAGMNKEEKLNLTSPMEQTDFASSSQWNLSFMFKQSNRNNLLNASNLFHNVSKEQLPAFIEIMGQQALSFQLILSKAWNQKNISQQNSLGARTKIIEPKNCEWNNQMIPLANVRLYHREQRFMPCPSIFTTKEKLFTQHGPCMHARQPQLIKQPAGISISRISNKTPKGEIVDDYFVWDCLFDDKQKNIEQIKARSHAVRRMSLKIKACISQIELATPKLARLCMLL